MTDLPSDPFIDHAETRAFVAGAIGLYLSRGDEALLDLLARANNQDLVAALHYLVTLPPRRAD